MVKENYQETIIEVFLRGGEDLFEIYDMILCGNGMENFEFLMKCKSK